MTNEAIILAILSARETMNICELSDEQKRRLRELQLEYHERLKPYINLLVDVESMTLHRLVIAQDGKFYKEERYSYEAKEIRAKCLEGIEKLKAEIEFRAETLRHEVGRADKKERK